MSAFRHLTPPVHGLFELLAGLALVIAPFALSVGPAGLVLSLGFGVLLVGLALGAEDGLPVSAHVAFDQALVIGLAGAAVALVAVDEGAAALVLAGVAAFELVLTLTTRYAHRALRR
ncbi:MAG TPA: hypothetical protein VF533_21480 [Solirubrobacteraceae bacterium]